MTAGKDTWQEAERNYRAFLLRCWQEEEIDRGGEPGGVESSWRFTLVQLEDDKRRGFACLDDLAAFLARELEVTRSPTRAEESS